MKIHTLLIFRHTHCYIGINISVKLTSGGIDVQQKLKSTLLKKEISLYHFLWVTSLIFQIGEYLQKDVGTPSELLFQQFYFSFS